MTETIRLKNIVKLFLLIISIWLVATVLPDTFAENINNEPNYSTQDDSVETPVAHLEDHLIYLETARRALNSEINNMDSSSAAFEHALERLADIDSEMAKIHAEMNQIWAAYDSSFDLDDFEIEFDEDIYDEESDDDDSTGWEYEYYIPYEPFAPYYEVAPMRMSDMEIAAFADAPLVDPIAITTANIAQFLAGTLGENDGHFVLNGPVTAPTARVAGRPGVFTGIIEGNGHTITGLRLGAAVGTTGVGLVQAAGDGAVIRNLNFTNIGTTDAARAVDFNAAATNANSRGVGMVIGQTVGPSATISIDNVHLVGNMQMSLRSTGDNFSSWGGMVGRVGAATTVNMRDVSVGNVQFHASATTGRLDIAGGLVGSVHGGTVNVTTNVRETNNIDLDMRGESRGTTAGPAAGNSITSGIRRGGGVVGYVFSGHVAIYDTVVTSRRMPIATGATNTGQLLDPIRVLGTVGGMVGGLNTAATVRLNNVENQAPIQVQWAGGDGRTQGTAPATPAGRIGGLIGHAGGTVNITNSRNYGVLQHQGNNAMIGGLVGYAGASSIVVINGSHNGASAVRPNQALPTGTLPGQLFHRNSNTGGTHNINSFAVMGGIVGRSRGRMTIENTENFANITKTLGNALGGGAGRRGRNNTRLGGIIGRANPAGNQGFTLTNVTNHANLDVAITTRGGGYVGGIIGELAPPARGRAGAMTLTNVTNNADWLVGGIHMGGIIARSRPANVIIRNATNTADLRRAASGTSGRPQTAGGIVGFNGGAGLRIETAVNTGNITTNTHTGATAAIGAERAGGIVGRNSGRALNINDTYNIGNVRGHQDTGGIVGLAAGRDVVINHAINRGNITGTRDRSRAIAGGIVGHSSGRNLLIRNAGNFGLVTVLGTRNSSMDGVGGVLGRSRGAATRIEISFNQGTITGRNSAGGIIGRNQGALNITDVYNIGWVHNGAATGANIRAGNGIIGRRRTGAVRITRGWVSARVGGYAVGVSQAGAAAQRNTGLVTGITFSGIFVDETTFHTTGTGFNANAPAIQRNRNGIFTVDTELLTSGYLPGFNSGPWRIGIQDVSHEQQRTYPYFFWQVPGGEASNSVLQDPFFTFIRTQQPLPPSASAAELELDLPTEADYDLDEERTSLAAPEEYDTDLLIEIEEALALLNEASTEATESASSLPSEASTEAIENASDLLNEEYTEATENTSSVLDEENTEATEADEEALEAEDDEYLSIEMMRDEWWGSLLPEPAPGHRWRPFMDLEYVPGHGVHFDFRCDFLDFDERFPNCQELSREGTRIFNTHRHSATMVSPWAPIVAGAETFHLNYNVAGMNSIGLISNNGVVGFEAREVTGRIMIRGYDPLFSRTETNPNYYFIDHARFEIVSFDEALVDLNGVFMGCLNENLYPCPVDQQVDLMRGLGMIRFEVDENYPDQIIGGIHPRDNGGDRPSQVYDPNRSSNASDVAASLDDFTVVRITALGYAPTYRIIYLQDLNMMSVASINVPMERVPFEIRVWVPQEAEEADIADGGNDNDYGEDLLEGPPGAAPLGTPPTGARPGFGVLPGHDPGSFLANYPVLNHTRDTRAVERFPNNETRHPLSPTTVTRSYEDGHTTESGGPGVRGHFQMQTVMWGDELEATALLHSTNTLGQLRYEHLINRGVSTWTTADEERVRVLDLDLYVRNIALPLMYFRFVELEGFDAEGTPIMRPLNIDGTNTAAIAAANGNPAIPAGPSPVISLTIDNDPHPNATQVRHHPSEAAPANNLTVHQPITTHPGQAADASEEPPLPAIAWRNQNQNAYAGNFQHFRVEGMSEEAMFSVVDTSEVFIARPDLAVADYFEWFYPLYITVWEDHDNEYDRRLDFGNLSRFGPGNPATVANNQANRDAAFDAAFEGDPILVRTLVIPLVRLREVPVHVVERVETAPGVFEYVFIDHSTLEHNENPVAGTPASSGIFTIINEGFNILYAEAEGFYSYELNASDIDEVITSTGYIRIVLEPRFLEVTFDLQDGVDQADFPDQIIRHGLTATQPGTNPTRAGAILDYEFDGWYTAPTGGTSFNFATPITEDTTVYARWTARHQVNFDLQDGEDQEDFPNQSVRNGDTATEPATDPTKDGYRFVGWYTAPEDGEEFDFDAPIIEDTTVYARWIPVTEFEFIKVNHLYDDRENANFERLPDAMFNLYIRETIAGECTEWEDYEEGICEEYADDDYDWVRLHEGIISDANGLVQFPQPVDAGREYKLVEIEAPEGFRLPVGHWYVSIDDDADRTITITRSEDEDEEPFTDVPFDYGYVPCQEGLEECESGDAWFVGNMRLGMEFRFTKTNDYLYLDVDRDPNVLRDPTDIPNNPNLERLAGAAFTLSRWEFDDVTNAYAWVIIEANVESDAAGLVEFDHLLTLEGEYRLDETRAPSGFRIPHGWWIIEWNDNTEQFDFTAGGTVSLVPAFRYVVCTVDNDLDKCYALEAGEVVYFVGNFPETILPGTGGIGAMTLTVIGALGLTFVVLLYLRGKAADDLVKIENNLIT